MTSGTFTQTQQWMSPERLPSSWKLDGGRAMTLHPRGAGLLRIEHGRIWATFDGPHAGPRNDMGDHVLGAGTRLALGAGQRLVIEAWSGEVPACLAWESPAFKG